MLDIKKIKNHFDDMKRLLELRGKGDYGLGELIVFDQKRRDILTSVEQMKNTQKNISKQIPKLKKEGRDVSVVQAEMKQLSEDIKKLDEEVKAIDESLKAKLLCIPNVPRPDTPIGQTEEDNVEIRKVGLPVPFKYKSKAHWDLGTDLNIIDFERATKMTGTRFNVLKGQGAKLERALINFMLDLHTEAHGYHEILPPVLVNRNSLIGTAQLPKFEADMFHLPERDFFLIPTGEVPITNLYASEILDVMDLPICHTACTPCFRKEAGSGGRDTRGLIRVHQFNKVELVKFTHPDHSDKALESLLLDAEEVLKRLDLSYRVVRLCSGDLTFASTKTYDIEVWMPSYGRYIEISSCSNCEDYQARRANIRFRDTESKKPRFVHTINGSGLAIGRTFAAILENYQNEDGTITIPQALIPYMGMKTKIIKN